MNDRADRTVASALATCACTVARSANGFRCQAGTLCVARAINSSMARRAMPHRFSIPSQLARKQQVVRHAPLLDDPPCFNPIDRHFFELNPLASRTDPDKVATVRAS